MKKQDNTLKSKKLIRVSLEYENLYNNSNENNNNKNNNIIHSIKITGDFFVYPEEALDNLEASLIGTRLEKDSIKQKIHDWLIGSEAFGFDSESLTEAILGCLVEQAKSNDAKEWETKKDGI